MNRILKILKKVVISAAIMIVGFSIIFYIWLTHRWKDTVGEEQLNNFVAYIDTTPEIPENFYEIHALVHKYNETTTTFWTLLAQPWNRIVLKNYSRTCPCMEVNYGFVTNGLDRWSVALELDDNVTPKKCLNAYLNAFSFGGSVRGIHEASNFYFKKDFEELSEDEMLSLSIMTKAPSRFNPFRNPELLKEELKKYKRINDK